MVHFNKPRWMALCLMAACAFTCGCSVVASYREDPPGTTEADAGPPDTSVNLAEQATGSRDAVVDRRSVSVPTLQVGDPPGDYVVGPHDVLFVSVKDQPDGGSPVVTISGSTLGSRVDGNGRIQLPIIGQAHVAGLTLSQIQRKLREGYSRVIKNPQVVVELVRPQSQPVNIIGEFNRPGVYYLDRPTTILDAMAKSGGVTSSAYVRGGSVMRGDDVLPVDVYALLREGRIDQNIYLHPGDTLYMPDREEQRVIVIGDVTKPGPLPVRPVGRLMLTEAMTLAGGYKTVESNLDNVRIIRSLSPTRGELITVNFQKILDGQALDFELYPDDIVYVPRSKLGQWNDVIREALPTLRAISLIVSPFVRGGVLVNSGN